MKKLLENKKCIVALYLIVAILPFPLLSLLGSFRIPIFTYKLFRPYINNFKIVILLATFILGKFVFKFSYPFKWKAFLKSLTLLTPFSLFIIYQHHKWWSYIKEMYTDYYLQKPIAIILVILLVGMFYEEFVYRGFLQNLAQKYFTLKTPLKTNIFSVLLTGLVFGLFHLISIWHANPELNIYPAINQVVYATGFGCLFGSVYLITKDIWGLILIHYWYDIPGVTDALLYWDAPWKDPTQVIPFNQHQFIFAVGQLVVEVALALIYLYIYDRRQKQRIS